MENKDTFQKKLAEIKLGTLVHDDWTKYLNKIKTKPKTVLSGLFGSRINLYHEKQDPL